MQLCRGVLVAALCLWSGAAARAQITIEVRDSSGAALPAAGTIESAAGGERRPFQTDSTGVYSLENPAPGRYRVTISKDGFAPQSFSIDVQPGSPVEVVAPTPLPGTDLALDQIPAPVQTATAGDLERSGALDLSDFLNKRLDGVHINQNQENPFQPDVNYRGYTASPLLGTPEGISVYVDGVRQNQPFGDVVAWDLIPEIAISEMALMPGSNPLFGLNTLGGALAVQTKDGYTAPKTMLSLSGGSFGRRQGEFENGGSTARGFHWYAAGNLFREDGWRQHSPSEVRQSFAKTGWRGARTALSLSFAYADNWLTGNGLQDFRFLQQNYSSVYSIPDVTWNHSPSFNLSGRHDFNSRLTLSGNAYFRYIRADTTNGDINSNSFDQSLYNLSPSDIAALTAAGYSGFPITGNAATEPFPKWRCIAQGLEKDEPVEKCDGILTNTYAKQHNYGLSGQLAWNAPRHHLQAGAAWDQSSITFQQGSQFAYLNPDRITFTPINAFADGSTNQDGVPVDTRV